MLDVMQAGTHAPWPFVRGFLVFLTRDYLVGPPGSFVGVADAALLAEGIGLLVFVVDRHSREHVARPGSFLAAIAVTSAAAALLTVVASLRTRQPRARRPTSVRLLWTSAGPACT